MRAAIYCRVSTIEQGEDGSSLATQEERCRAYAHEQGYEVDEQHVYREMHTGVELWERPKLTMLREAIRRHEVDVVVAYAIDRLARDPVHLGVVISEADHAGCEVAFVTEPLDHSPEGQLIRFVRGYAAKVEHEKIKERTIRGRLARLRSGRMMPSNRPLYGYQFNEDKSAYVVDPVTSVIVRRIFSEVARGDTLRSIAARLTAEGVPTPTGRSPIWQGSSLKSILDHPGYTGEALAWRRQQVKRRGTKVVTFRPESEQIRLPEGTIPAIVDRETFAIAQQRRTFNQAQAARHNPDPERSLLRGGYVRCGYCGAAMCVSNLRYGGRYQCGRTMGPKGICSSHSVLVDELDRAVWSKVREVLVNPELIATELERLQAQDTETESTAAVARAISELEKQQQILVNNLAVVTGRSAELVGQKLAELDRQLQALTLQRVAATDQVQAHQAARERVATLEEWCHQVAGRLDELTYGERRVALEGLGIRVQVWRADHEPRYEITATIPLDAPIVSTSSCGCGHNMTICLRWTDADVPHCTDERCCEACGAPFEATRPDRRYCSVRCYQRWFHREQRARIKQLT